MSGFDTVLVRESVLAALAKLDELKRSVDVLQAEIRGDFERKMELFRFSQVRKEFLGSFFEEPYVIIPKRADEWYVIAPKWLNFSIGWLERSTKSYNIFVVNRYVKWFSEIPPSLEEKFKFAKSLPFKVYDGMLLTGKELQEEALRRYKRFISRREGEDRLRIKKGYEFKLIAQMIEDVTLTFMPNPVKVEDLRAYDGIKLRSYQEYAWNEFLSKGAIGLFWAFGSGKSLFGIYALARVKGRKLVVVPTLTLREQWLERIAKYIPQYRNELEVVTYHAYDKVRNNEYSLVCYDECLPYGSKILTEHGYRCIGEIVENREKLKVASLNGKKIEWKPITFWFKKYAAQLIVLNSQIALTPTHKVLTPRGLIPAKDLKVDDAIYVSWDMNENLPHLRKELYQHTQPLETSSQNSWNRTNKYLFNLREDFQQSLSAWWTCKGGSLQPQYPCFERASLEISQPRAFRNFQKDAVREKTRRVKPQLEGGETQDDCKENCLSTSGRAENLHVMRRVPRRGVGCSPYRWKQSQQHKRELNHSLSLLPRKHPSRRNSGISEHGASLFTNGTAYPIRQTATIFKIETIQLPSQIPVYDIEVADNHNFLAQGFWVSNCQHLPANSFVRLATLKAKYRMGFSGSPYREDGRENYIIALTGFPIGMSWEELIRLQVVCEPTFRVYILSDNREKMRKLGELLQVPAKTLIFCDWLDLGEKIAETFNIPFVYGETKDRLEIIRESQACVVSRVGDEGVSLPDIERVIEVAYLYGSRMQESQRFGRLMHSAKEELEHIILMSEEEFEKYQKRLYAITERGFRIEFVR
jgi:hypothetical protein